MALILYSIAALLAAAAFGGAVVYQMTRVGKTATAVSVDTVATGPVFLFNGPDLIDTTPDAQQMIAPFAHMPDRDALLQVLEPLFPAISTHLDAGTKIPCRIAHAHHAGAWIDLDWPNGQLRVSVKGALPTGIGDLQMSELALLRDITRFAPQLIWRTDTDGVVIWANQAYQDFWLRLHPHSTDKLATRTLFAPYSNKTTPGASTLRRLAVNVPSQGADQWFDVATICQEQTALHFANDANAAVRADQERRNFVQTLGKTFAELSIGLAIFDKSRKLATFNPALLDMTRLGFEFLSTRPTIDTVLDRLRETRILPEPKDYVSWRDRFTAVETAAKNGTYCEVWNLPDGQAFRVTGRPHPDGAFAFLFEDITADLSLARRFRSDIETGQAVLDALPDAVAVFTGAGTLVMYNRAYTALWGGRPEQGLEHRVLASEIDRWQGRCIDTDTWSELQASLLLSGPRKHWSDDALLADGQLVRCTAGPIAGGMTLVRFTLAMRNLPVLRKLTQTDPAIRAAKR